MSRINFLSSVLGYKLYIGIGVLIAGLLMTWHIVEVNKMRTEITQQVTLKITSEYNRKLIRNQEQVIITNQELQKAQDANTTKLQKNLKSTAVKYDDFVVSLSDRPLRLSRSANFSGSTSVTINSKDRQGSTGTGLYKEDAEFLARYSRITEELKLNLISCYESYDNAKIKLEQYSKDIKDSKATSTVLLPSPKTN